MTNREIAQLIKWIKKNPHIPIGCSSFGKIEKAYGMTSTKLSANDRRHTYQLIIETFRNRKDIMGWYCKSKYAKLLRR